MTDEYRIAWDRKLLRKWTEEFLTASEVNPPAYLAYIRQSLRFSIDSDDPSCTPFIYMRHAIEQAQEDILQGCVKAVVAGRGHKFTAKDIKARTFRVLRDREWLKAEGACSADE